jgi:ADP-ribosyltransferase exoenzyme
MMPEQDDAIPMNAEQRRVAAMLTQLARRCRQIILNPPGKTDARKSWNASQAAAKIASIERELKALNLAASIRIPSSLQPRFDRGLEDADKQLRAAGVLADGDPIKGSFAMVSSDRAKILVRNTMGDVAKAGKTTIDETRKTSRKIHALGLNDKDIKTLLAGGTIEGIPKHTLAELRKRCQAVADKDGKLWVVNKHGEAMSFDPQTYADLVFQTANAEAVNIATQERLKSKGINYVKIIGSNSANFCTAFVGKVYYIGEGTDPLGLYPHIRELPRGGAPFHPRCTKRYVAFIPKLATRKEIEQAKPNDETKRLHGVGRDEAQQRYEGGRKSGPKKQSSPAAANTPSKPVQSGGPVVPPIPQSSPQVKFSSAIQQHADNVAKLMTPDEVGAISRYQSKGPKKGAGYQDVNAWHRFKTPPTRGQAWVDQVTAGLDSAIAKSTLPESVDTYRAIRGTPELIAKWKDAAADRFPWTEDAFFSTSATPAIASDFWGTNSTRVVFRVQLPVGIQAVIPSAVTGRMKEQLEVILGRGHQFEIESVDDSGDTIIVKARILK